MGYNENVDYILDAIILFSRNILLEKITVKVQGIKKSPDLGLKIRISRFSVKDPIIKCELIQFCPVRKWYFTNVVNILMVEMMRGYRAILKRQILDALDKLYDALLKVEDE